MNGDHDQMPHLAPVLDELDPDQTEQVLAYLDAFSYLTNPRTRLQAIADHLGTFPAGHPLRTAWEAVAHDLRDRLAFDTLTEELEE